MIKWRQ